MAFLLRTILDSNLHNVDAKAVHKRLGIGVNPVFP